MGKFGDNLRRTRKGLGLTQDAAAERCGLSAKYIGELERAEASPTLEAVDKLARGLNVDVLVLVGDDAERLDLPTVRAEIVRGLDGLAEGQLRQVLRIVRLANHR